MQHSCRCHGFYMGWALGFPVEHDGLWKSAQIRCQCVRQNSHGWRHWEEEAWYFARRTLEKIYFRVLMQGMLFFSFYYWALLTSFLFLMGIFPFLFSKAFLTTITSSGPCPISTHASYKMADVVGAVESRLCGSSSSIPEAEGATVGFFSRRLMDLIFNIFFDILLQFDRLIFA